MSRTEAVDIGSILSEQKIRKILDAFRLSTGICACFHWAREQPQQPERYGDPCDFCALVQSCPEGARRCRAFMQDAGRQAAQRGECYIARCHAGLVELYAPVMVEQRYLGFISCGPVLMWEWDEITNDDILRRIGDLGLPEQALRSRGQQIPMFDVKSVQASADLLLVVVSSLASAGMTELHQRQEISAQQARIAELIFEKKRAEEAITALESRQRQTYPLQKEKELLGRIRLGDRTRAKEILNEILGEIFFHDAGNLSVLKARVLELVVVMSRAAVESGASMEKLLGMNYQLIGQLSGIEEFEALCIWVVDRLDAIMDTIYETRNVRNAKALAEAMECIRTRFSQNLTLEDVARQVYLSPFYLSHLFREELGITFIEYLTRVRMEEARKLLRGGGETIANVAARVGYEDASYFSKVFRKMYGVTPRQYRQG